MTLLYLLKQRGSFSLHSYLCCSVEAWSGHSDQVERFLFLVKPNGFQISSASKNSHLIPFTQATKKRMQGENMAQLLLPVM